MISAQLTEGLLKKFGSREDRVGQATKPISIAVSDKDEILKRLDKHLSGDLRLGLYNLLPDGSVRWAVVEFEHHGEVAGEDTCLTNAVKYQQRLIGIGIPSILERSKNLNGQCYHLHLCFDKALPARIVREGLRGIGRELFGAFPNEIFPKGDDGFGNFIWMPLFGGKDEWGLGIKEGRTVFIDMEGLPFHDQNAALANWQNADSQHFLSIIKPLLAAQPTPIQPSRNGNGIELNQPGLEKMEANCPIVKRWITDPSGWQYDHWLGLGSNYIVFKGGWERFVELSAKDTANFSQYEIDRIRDEVLGFHGPQTYDKFRDQGLDFEVPGAAPKAPAGWGSWTDPADDPIKEENGTYMKWTKAGFKEVLSTFIIEPKELLRLPDGDALSCTVCATDGYTYEKVIIENTDWYTRSKLAGTIGHSDCTFHGSDLDAIDICRHVIRKVPVRKEGTRMIGLHNDHWVLRDCNINAAGYVEPMQLVPYDRSSESLHTKIHYQHLDDGAYRALVEGYFGHILKVNLPQVIQPILGWFFASPLKPIIQEIDGSFPLLMCYGTKGAGKTTILEKLLAFQGYTNTTPHSCTTKSFPLLRLLASTNAIPVFLDEYKDDMKQDEKSNIKRYMRKAFRGEIEEKGNPDQTVTAYYLEAPMIICGELKITEPAILERVIIGGFNDAITDHPAMQQAFSAINSLDAAGFMDRYIMFCLKVDVSGQLQKAKEITRRCLGNLTVNPRVFINLAVMVFGLLMMIDFAGQWGVDLSEKIDFGGLITSQVEEITGNGNGKVKNAADILLEQMSMMIEKGVLPKGISWTFARPKQASKELLCIHLPSAAAEVTAYKQRMHADFEVVDESAYRKQYENSPYKVRTQVGVKFTTDADGVKIERTKRAVLIDYEKALASGLDIIGFRSDDQLQKTPILTDADSDFSLEG
jgi:hypothetical protein